jgi:basic amino acid/polyamine antiporter, APA family
LPINPPRPPLPEAPGASLERRLGPLDAAAIVVSNVIGGGIFFVPILVAQLVPDVRVMLLVWLVGGLLALAGAMAYAELAALRPVSGGEYVYLRDAFGPGAAFLSGWTSFVAGFSGAIAASALALAEYVGRFVPVAGDASPILTVPLPLVPLVVSPKTLVALGTIGVLTMAHMRGLGPGRLVQNVLAALKVTILVGFLLAGFGTERVSGAIAAAPSSFSLTAILLALIPVMFAYSGWNAASYVAEEVRSPGRNVPLALGLGTAVVVVLYVGLNALYLRALPIAELAALTGTLMDTVAERLFGFAVGHFTAAFTIVSLAASVSAMILAGPRVYFAMARDGVFPRHMGVVHHRFRAPTAAIFGQAVWSSVLVVSGSLAQLVSYTGFAVLLFSGIAVSSVFVLRRRDPTANRPFRTWGYPWAPAAFVGVSAIVVVNEIWRNPGPSMGGLIVIAAGLPIYWWSKRS